MNTKRLLVPLLSFLAINVIPLPAASITVDTARPGAAINPGMWGIFFEDINFGADGGLYAELIKNRDVRNYDATYSSTHASASEVRFVS